MCRNRHFLRKKDDSGQVFHLHIVVEHTTWDERKERLMRDYLLAHPEAVDGYGALKTELAQKYSEESLAYTKAKTAFIQEVLDKARDARNLPRIDMSGTTSKSAGLCRFALVIKRPFSHNSEGIRPYLHSL